MKIVAPGSADPSGKTAAGGRLNAAKADGARPAAWAGAHRSACSAYTADPLAQAAVAKAAPAEAAAQRLHD
jgi:hypothetical protein